MNTVPIWLYLIILFFVYDDVWFSAEENPYIHYFLVMLLIVPTFLFAIGQGRVVKESVRLVTEKLKEHIAFLR